MVYQRVSLKVCEGCGTLWVREAQMRAVYCRPCAGLLQHFPDPQTRRRVGRPTKDRSISTCAQPGRLAAGGAR
jgi:hypothetical protein